MREVEGGGVGREETNVCSAIIIICGVMRWNWEEHFQFIARHGNAAEWKWSYDLERNGEKRRYFAASEVRVVVVVSAVCILPEERGPCNVPIVKWRYNHNLGLCQSFTFGGCEGNDNKFDTRKECEGFCSVFGLLSLASFDHLETASLPFFTFEHIASQLTIGNCSDCSTGNWSDYRPIKTIEVVISKWHSLCNWFEALNYLNCAHNISANVSLRENRKRIYLIENWFNSFWTFDFSRYLPFASRCR